MSRKVIAMSLLVCLVVGILPIAASAHSGLEAHEGHDSQTQMPPADILDEKVGELKARVAQLGGRLFTSKTDLEAHVRTSVPESLAPRMLDTILKMDNNFPFYVIYPPNENNHAAADAQSGGGEYVVAAIEWCNLCLDWKEVVLEFLLEKFLESAYQVYLYWRMNNEDDQGHTLAPAEKETTVSECPDCLQAGSPRVVSSTGTRATLYCPRLQTTWYEYNPLY